MTGQSSAPIRSSTPEAKERASISKDKASSGWQGPFTLKDGVAGLGVLTVLGLLFTAVTAAIMTACLYTSLDRISSGLRKLGERMQRWAEEEQQEQEKQAAGGSSSDGTEPGQDGGAGRIPAVGAGEQPTPLVEETCSVNEA